MTNRNQVIANVHSLSHDGRGIATIENKTTFIKNGLPGEVLTCKITDKKSSFNCAEMLNIQQASPERATPPCQHFGLCGGCSLQHMSDQLQLSYKETTLLEQLLHFGKVQPERVLAPLHSASTGYRRKARLGVKYVIKKEKVLVGFREQASRYLADLESCQVLYPKVGLHLKDLSALVASLSIYQHIAQIEVAIGDDDVALVFRHLEPLTSSDHEKLIQFAQQFAMHIYLQPNSPLPITKLWPDDGKERLSYTLPDQNLEFLFHPLDFTQINLDINRMMINQALSLLEINTNDCVLDLYCGIGNFSLPLARSAKQVIGIEGCELMVERASENARHNGLTNCEFQAANLMAETITGAWTQKTFNKILLDPPRAGAKEILALIANCKTEKIVYVSCNPATLARDAGELVNRYGYKLKAAGIMNMFPHTAHIEAMALFEK